MLRRIATTTGLVILALAFALPSGCVQFYKVKKVRKSLAKTQRKVAQLVLEAERDLKTRKAQLIKLGRNSPDLTALFADMTARVDELKAGKAKLDTLKTDFDRLAGRKKKIREGDPGWKEIEQLREDYERLADEMRRAAKAYEKGVKRFLKALR